MFQSAWFVDLVSCLNEQLLCANSSLNGYSDSKLQSVMDTVCEVFKRIVFTTVTSHSTGHYRLVPAKLRLMTLRTSRKTIDVMWRS